MIQDQQKNKIFKLVGGALKRRSHRVTAITLFVVTGVVTLLLGYFLHHECILRRKCKSDYTCVWSAQWCDGQRDCPSGDDENFCFHLHGSKFMLQSFSNTDQQWKTVCSHNWNDTFGKIVCEQMGYNSTFYVSSQQIHPIPNSTSGYMILHSNKTSSSTFSHAALISSSICPTNAALSLKCIECGIQTDTDPRVAGGHIVTKKGRWPWQVSLHSSKVHECGGSIITPYWIVTAAHCFLAFPSTHQWKVFAGYLKLTDMTSAMGKSVSMIIKHPNYDPHTNDNDVALIKLNHALKMSSSVRPICLPNESLKFTAPRDCYVTGWGATHSKGAISNELREAIVPLIDRTICNKVMIYNGLVTESMICAGRLEGNVDSCQGDSGGPLVIQENSVWWLVGDTSWGDDCAQPYMPGVYGNITYFVKWIYEQIQVHSGLM